MDITLNFSGILYAGTGLTLICMITVDPNADSNESVIVTWSGQSLLSREQYSVTNDTAYAKTVSLIISPLSEEDDSGEYMCSVTVWGGANVLEATGKENINITILGKHIIRSYY